MSTSSSTDLLGGLIVVVLRVPSLIIDYDLGVQNGSRLYCSSSVKNLILGSVELMCHPHNDTRPGVGWVW